MQHKIFREVDANRMTDMTENGNALEQLMSRNTAAPGAPVGTVHYIYNFDGWLNLTSITDTPTSHNMNSPF